MEKICLGDDPRAVTDRLLNSVAMRALMQFDSRLWQDASYRFLQYFSILLTEKVETVSAFLSDSQNISMNKIELSNDYSGLHAKIFSNFTFQFTQIFGWLILANSYLMLFGGLCWIIWIASVYRTYLQEELISFALFSSALLYALALSVTTVFLPRYADFMTVLLLIFLTIRIQKLQITSNIPSIRIYM